MRRVLHLAVAGALAGCSGTSTSTVASNAWRGTITTDGAVTTVVNESGSVWGGPARLVEEASIGVLEGEDEYMLGGVSAIASDGTHIFVADRQVPIVRAYDLSGQYVRDFGAEGQGPGEYQLPASMAVDPGGRVLVRDDRGRRILVYTADGEFLEHYAMEGGLQTGTAMRVGPDGTPYTIVIVESLENDPSRLWVLGMKAHGPDGPYGEPLTPPTYDFESGVLVARRDGGTSMNNVPFWPTEHWTFTHQLGIVSGVSNEYRFEWKKPDQTTLVVVGAGAAVAVDPDERDWHRRRATAQMRGMDPAWVWDGPEIPATKPAYNRLVVTHSGEIWVARPGPGERVEPCNEDAEESRDFSSAPCWREGTTIDVFGTDGRLLGELQLPAGLSLYPEPFIDGDTVIARVQDVDGVVTVKRYRLVTDS